MNIERDAEGGFIFSDVEASLAAMFRAIPSAADPEGSKAALDRLFPDPAAGKEAGLSAEWADYVRPELREGFENASTTVEADLEPLNAGEDGWTIPRDHIDAWLNTLNQARLVLASRYEVDEADMNRTAPYPPESERTLAVSQIHVYGLLQECLLQNLE
ncbi:MAG: DUF2017 family protein [Verrucomicrobia bacterium]|nr:DUF2017 family protein [Verrucomicrobiota bacterium]